MSGVTSPEPPRDLAAELLASIEAARATRAGSVPLDPTQKCGCGVAGCTADEDAPGCHYYENHQFPCCAELVRLRTENSSQADQIAKFKNALGQQTEYNKKLSNKLHSIRWKRGRNLNHIEELRAEITQLRAQLEDALTWRAGED